MMQVGEHVSQHLPLPGLFAPRLPPEPESSKRSHLSLNSVDADSYCCMWWHPIASCSEAEQEGVAAAVLVTWAMANHSKRHCVTGVVSQLECSWLPATCTQPAVTCSSG